MISVILSCSCWSRDYHAYNIILYTDYFTFFYFISKPLFMDMDMDMDMDIYIYIYIYI